jgi:hypothetical protein
MFNGKKNVLRGFKFLLEMFENWKLETHSYELIDLSQKVDCSWKYDFIYLDEIQDVPTDVVLDLATKSKCGFIGFGDNA